MIFCFWFTDLTPKPYLQGVTDYRVDVLKYLRANHVSIILLLRRNLLRRMVSILANSYDAKMRVLDGEHKAHVTTEEEVRANHISQF